MAGLMVITARPLASLWMAVMVLYELLAMFGSLPVLAV
jgi:hypothetical protein